LEFCSAASCVFVIRNIDYACWNLFFYVLCVNTAVCKFNIFNIKNSTFSHLRGSYFRMLLALYYRWTSSKWLWFCKVPIRI